jgi:hypothetical protein
MAMERRAVLAFRGERLPHRLFLSDRRAFFERSAFVASEGSRFGGISGSDFRLAR